MKRMIKGVVAGIVAALCIPALASAHVVVSPATASIGQHVVFTIAVPNERQAAVSRVRLAIPRGLTDVQPDVTAGWEIATTQAADAVTSITWTGSIPAGQRAELRFAAQVPDNPGELAWKAQQTYSDGTTVSWNQKPTADDADNDSASSGPYSITKVTDDLTANGGAIAGTAPPLQAKLALVLGIASLALSIGALVLPRVRGKQ